jgi:hypothetical protein
MTHAQAYALLGVVRAAYGPLLRLRRRDYVTFGALALAGLVGNTMAWYFEVLRTLSLNRGDVIILGSQVLWATDTLYSRANISSLPSATVQAGVYVVSAAVLAPLALLERPWTTLPRAGWAGWGAVLYAAAFGTISHIWVLPLRARGGSGAGRRLHEPHAVRGDRALGADPGRAHPLVSPGRRHRRPGRRRPGDVEVAARPITPQRAWVGYRRGRPLAVSQAGHGPTAAGLA